MRVRNGVVPAMKPRCVRFGPANALILLLGAVLVIFTRLHRLGTDALHFRTGSATAAALFGAILAAWLIASVLPLT
jgi:hypothetical protein